jgi:hypothetical protein
MFNKKGVKNMLEVTKTTVEEKVTKAALLQSIKDEFGPITGLHSVILHKNDVKGLRAARAYDSPCHMYPTFYKEAEWQDNGILFIYFTPKSLI